jgi:hypothetical protein
MSPSFARLNKSRNFLTAAPKSRLQPTAATWSLMRSPLISRVLKSFDYPRCSKHDRGALRRHLQHTSGYSRVQLTRLVKQWCATVVQCCPCQALQSPCGTLRTQVHRQGVSLTTLQCATCPRGQPSPASSFQALQRIGCGRKNRPALHRFRGKAGVR